MRSDKYEVNVVKSIIASVVFFIIGIILIVSSIADTISLSKGITDFNEMKCEEFQNGRFVQGTLQFLDNGFAEEYMQEYGSSEKDVTSSYYLMQLLAHGDELKYITVCFSKDTDIETADKMVTEMEEYYESGTMPDNATTMEFTGKVSKLDKEIVQLLYDRLIESDFGLDKEECSKYVCDYCITPCEIDTKSPVVFGTILLLFGVIGFVISVLQFLRIKR